MEFAIGFLLVTFRFTLHHVSLFKPTGQKAKVKKKGLAPFRCLLFFFFLCGIDNSGGGTLLWHYNPHRRFGGAFGHIAGHDTVRFIDYFLPAFPSNSPSKCVASTNEVVRGMDTSSPSVSVL